MIMKTIITLAAILMISSCSGIADTRQMSTLPDIVQVGHSILSRDTTDSAAFPTLTVEQCLTLNEQTHRDVPAGTQLIGTRTAGQGIILQAYKIPTGEDPNQFKVYLVTLNSKDMVIDHIDLGEFHTSEHQGPMRFGGNRFYTTDAELRFDEQTHIILHRMLTLTSLYLKDHSLNEIWRVEWDNHYDIDANGHFTFDRQQETHRSPDDLDAPIIDQYKSRDLPGQRP